MTYQLDAFSVGLRRAYAKARDMADKTARVFSADELRAFAESRGAKVASVPLTSHAKIRQARPRRDAWFGY